MRKGRKTTGFARQVMKAGRCCVVQSQTQSAFNRESLTYRHLDRDSRHDRRPRARFTAEVLGVLLHVGNRPQRVDKLMSRGE